MDIINKILMDPVFYFYIGLGYGVFLFCMVVVSFALAEIAKQLKRMNDK